MKESPSIIDNTIVVDAMGSDSGPSEVIAGIKLAFKTTPTIQKIILVGNEYTVLPLLKRFRLDQDPRLEFLHASEVITMEDKPIQALKSKKDASMFKAMELVKEGKARLMLSAGNTGALMAGGTIKLRPLEGVDRPAIGTVWPGQDSNFVLIDAGANPQSTSQNLVHNAILGSHYARRALKVNNPSIGLLTIGTEEGKGTEVTNIAHHYLKNCRSFLNYQGLIEGFEVFTDKVDVIVCDGFVGNIVLKTCESLFRMLKRSLREELTKNWMGRVGGVLALPSFHNLKKRLSPERFGGAPLLGLKGHILKSHGSSNRTAIMHAIRIGLNLIEHNIMPEIVEDVKKANDVILEDNLNKK